jgi:tetratricopeptide (TPR) repeat protein
MYSKEKLLEMLASEKTSIRYEAIEWIRVSQESSPELVRALENATHDVDKEVAERANLALQAEVHHQMAIKMGIIEPVMEEATNNQPEPMVVPEFQTVSAETTGETQISKSAEEELIAYVGPGWEHYLDAWKPAITGVGKIGSFNIGGFFFSVLWLCYRKMYQYAILFFGIIFCTTIASVLFQELSGKAVPRLLNSGMGIVFAIIIGAFGDRWYFTKAKRSISQVQSKGVSQEESLRLIAKRGGKSIWAALGCLILFSGILMLSVFAVLFVKEVYNLLIVGGSNYTQGVEYYNKGDYDNAISEYDKAIEFNPNIAQVYNLRGLAFYAKGDKESAISDWNKAIQLKPDFAEAYVNRGNAYGDKGELDLALNDYAKAIQLDPKYAEAYHNRGLVYVFKGELDQAIQDFDQAIQLNPNVTVAYYNRGIAYGKKGDTQNAITDFKKALELCGDNTQLCFNIKQALQEVEGK